MITLATAKNHIRVEHDDEDDLIQHYIDAALAWVVRYTGENYLDTIIELEQAQLLLISHWYENREAVVVGSASSELPMAVEALAGPYRLPTLK